MTTITAPVIHTRPAASHNQASVSVDPAPQAAVSATQMPTGHPANALATALADHCNQCTLVAKLTTLSQRLAAQVRPSPSSTMGKPSAEIETVLASQLKNTTMYVCDNASFRPQQPLPFNRLVSLEAYIQGCGMEVPKTLEALISLKNTLARRAQVHPLGNFGGALSWPVAMPVSDRSSITALLNSAASGLPGLPLDDSGKGALGYLMTGSTVTETDLKTPVIALEKLLGSSKAQSLGKVLQSSLDGIPSDIGVTDYVMTAIHLGLDPKVDPGPTRDRIAGFDLARSQHWGQPPSVVVDGLARHLVEKGRASAQTAPLGAYLLLARTAPEFLVKDVPASVTYGNVLWAQLARAVARIEAQTPGRTLAMGYAEILLESEGVTTDDIVKQQINYQALKSWGVANGFLAAPAQAPSNDEMERVRAAYNSHLSSLKNASTLLQTQIPSRKTMALEQLKEAFPQVDASLFEVREIQKARLTEGRPGVYPGMRSMLDIVMEGGELGAGNHWITHDNRIPITSFCGAYEAGKLGVPLLFKSAYDEAIKAHEEGQQIKVRHLIASLPLEDRKNLAEGQLEFFHTHQYKIALDLFTPPALHVRGHTLEVKTTRNGQVNLYTIDTRLGTLEKKNFLIHRRTEPYTSAKMEVQNANILSRTVVFNPDEDAQQSSEKPDRVGQPDSFNASRSHYIANAFVKSLDLKRDDLLKEARDVTSYDLDEARNDAVYQFLLNLIPLRSAVVNFQNGNVFDGVFDLAMDAIGLITLGAGKAAQAGKVVGKAFSSARQLIKATKFVGATVIEALNPLSGLGDLAVGAGRLAVTGSRHVARRVGQQLNQLRGAAGSYDLLKAASKQHGEIATGMFRVGGQSVEGSAVLHKGKWYAFDADAMRPYGRPLEHFTPDIHAVRGVAGKADAEYGRALSNTVFRHFSVPDTPLTGLTRNSQGVYVSVNGHTSHIRHTDKTGQTAVYEVRQVTRTEDGVVQARVYHNNRQTELLLQHVQGDEWQRLGAQGGVLINGDHLRAWEAMSVQARQQLTVDGFAKLYRLYPPALAHFVRADGTLSAAGVVVRNRPAGMPMNPITPVHVREWQGMTQQARDATTLEGFAATHHLDKSHLTGHVTQDGGLTFGGEALLFKAAGGAYAQITDTHVLQWSQLAQQPNNQLTPAAFCRQHNLNPKTWATYFRQDGTPSDIGLRRINRAQAALPPVQEPPRKRPAPAPVDPSEQRPQKLPTPTPPTQNVQRPERPSVIVPTVKTEPGVSSIRTLSPHQIDNSLPILQDPSNPKISLTQALEGPIDNIRVSYWNGLLDGMAPAEKTAVRNRVKASIKDWLRTEGQHGAKFDDALEVVTPLDDGGPARGSSVFARRDIPKFEVLGPYSGKYHGTEDSLFQEQRKQGSRAVLTYLFGTRSGTRTVSALNSGNTLSLVNTSQLRDGPAWQSNNVGSIAVGKNLTFYVALKDIKAGDELLMDYGPLYDPVPDIAIKPDPDAR